MKDFLVVNIELQPLEPYREILIALLDNMGYDSFEESETGLKAYILEADFDETEFKALPILHNEELTWSFNTEKLESINWNEEWERHYEPVFVNDQLHIRAPFHPAKEGFQYEIVIEPKMSFGTGHHHTTRLMAKMMLTINWQGLKVLDMGTGTGVLAILAEKLGAGDITAIDNFEWAAVNTAENAERNNCTRVTAQLGDAAELENRHFDAVLANINRNVLLEDMKAYADTLASGGHLIMSGFLEPDFQLIDKAARQLGFSPKHKLGENNWMCCHYRKQ